MSANNPVFQILVAPNDTANDITTAGKTMAELLTAPHGVGAMGVFSADTKLSLSSAAGSVGVEREIFIAMAVDTDGDGVADSIVTSAGQSIQKKGVTNYSLRCYAPQRAHIVDIEDISGIQCETGYTFKINFTGNTQAYQNFGFNQFVKTFSVKTGCCGPDCDCPSGDCNNLVDLLIKAINADTDGLVTAVPIDVTTTPGTPIPLVDNEGTGFTDEITTWAADPANANKCLGIRLTSVPSKVYTYCQVPARYYKNVQFKMVVSLLEPLDCRATFSTFQEPVFGEGQGKDIGWLEYEAGGYNGKPGPYRVGELAGLPIGTFERVSTNGGQYNQVNLFYRNESIAGWDEHKNYLNTIIAVPCTESGGTGVNNKLNAILPIIDTFLTGYFDPLDDDLDECDCNQTGVVYTTDINDVTEDGLA